jgi:hypothetical protein
MLKSTAPHSALPKSTLQQRCHLAFTARSLLVRPPLDEFHQGKGGALSLVG